METAFSVPARIPINRPMLFSGAFSAAGFLADPLAAALEFFLKKG
jgi:hypothetical protein